MIKSPATRKIIKTCIILLLILLIVVSSLSIFSPQWLSDHLGIAVYSSYLPNRISFARRLYDKGYSCLSLREVNEKFEVSNNLPKIESVQPSGYVWNFFGLPLSIFDARSIYFTYSSTEIFVKYRNCFISYGLVGGP